SCRVTAPEQKMTGISRSYILIRLHNSTPFNSGIQSSRTIALKHSVAASFEASSELPTTETRKPEQPNIRAKVFEHQSRRQIKMKNERARRLMLWDSFGKCRSLLFRSSSDPE